MLEEALVQRPGRIDLAVEIPSETQALSRSLLGAGDEPAADSFGPQDSGLFDGGGPVPGFAPPPFAHRAMPHSAISWSAG